MPRGERGVGTHCLLILALLGVLPSLVSADSKCKLGQIAQFPIRIDGWRATLAAGINGVDAEFMLDSGAFYSLLTDAGASQFKLETHRAPFGFYVTGVHGGTADVSIATVKTFTLAGVPVKNVEFLVGGSDPRAGTIGTIGQNVLHLADVEYDLRQGIVRLMKPIDCGKTFLAYWAAGTAQPYSVISIDQGVRPNWHTIGSAYVNGAEIRVQFDTGAPTSVLSTRAAARAGITPDSPGVIPAGQSGGIGRVSYPTYIAPFASFKIGDEEIKNAKLRIADLQLQNADMLLGLDFFLSHHIYVANSQSKLYFTYEGGPVFDLKTRRSPGDAPDNPDYLYQRGMALWRNKQPDLAQADFERAIRVAPGNVPVRIAHAELSLSRGDRSGGGAELDAADAAAPKEADIRLTLAELYGRADLLDQSLKQFDLWIEFHSVDGRMPEALNGRCWIRALQGTQLPQALKDCNAARGRVDKSNPLLARILDSRALVFLRMNEYEKSMADYDVSLKMNPKSAWGWYGRGIVELRLNKAAAGNTDIEHAKTLAPKVADAFSRYGITP